MNPPCPSRYIQKSRTVSIARARELDAEYARDHVYDGLQPNLRLSAEFVELMAMPAVFLLMLANHGIRILIRKALLSMQMRETKSKASLRGAPQPAAIDTAWHITPRTVTDALRIGSRLLDLEPTIDNSFVWHVDAKSGARTIIARRPGIKGWLKLHCPTVRYGTAMRYKKLASRLRTICSLPGNIPLEWILPDGEKPSAPLNKNAMVAVAKGTGILRKILQEETSLRGLDRIVAKRMKIVRLPGKKRVFSLISHHQQRPGTSSDRPRKNPAAKGKKTADRAEKRAEQNTMALREQALHIASAIQLAGTRRHGRPFLRQLLKILSHPTAAGATRSKHPFPIIIDPTRGSTRNQPIRHARGNNNPQKATHAKAPLHEMPPMHPHRRHGTKTK